MRLLLEGADVEEAWMLHKFRVALNLERRVMVGQNIMRYCGSGLVVGLMHCAHPGPAIVQRTSMLLPWIQFQDSLVRLARRRRYFEVYVRFWRCGKEATNRYTYNQKVRQLVIILHNIQT